MSENEADPHHIFDIFTRLDVANSPLDGHGMSCFPHADHKFSTTDTMPRSLIDVTASTANADMKIWGRVEMQLEYRHNTNTEIGRPRVNTRS